MFRPDEKAMVEDHTKIERTAFISNNSIFRAITIFKNIFKTSTSQNQKYSSKLNGSSVHLVFERSFPPASSPPILLEITLLQLYWNWTKKHLVVNGTVNLHMVAFCGWDHLATCLQSSSPDSYTITSQRPTLQLCLSSSLTVLMVGGDTVICN